MDQLSLHTALSYDPESGLFSWAERRRNVKVGDPAGGINRKGYLYIGFANTSYRANRLAWFYVHGVWPSGQIDHINGDRTDNRIANLRDVSGAANQQNRRVGNRNSSSRLLGVSWHAGSRKWRAQISVGHSTRHVGMFDSEEAAHAAYLSAKALHHCSAQELAVSLKNV